MKSSENNEALDTKQYRCPAHPEGSVEKAWCELKRFWSEGYVDFIRRELGLGAGFTYEDFRDKLAEKKLSVQDLRALAGNKATPQEYLKYVVHPEDLKWLMDAANKPKSGITASTLRNMAHWIYGLYADDNKLITDEQAKTMALAPTLPVPFLGSPTEAKIVAVANNPGYDSPNEPLRDRGDFDTTQQQNLERLADPPPNRATVTSKNLSRGH